MVLKQGLCFSTVTAQIGSTVTTNNNPKSLKDSSIKLEETFGTQFKSSRRSEKGLVPNVTGTQRKLFRGLGTRFNFYCVAVAQSVERPSKVLPGLEQLNRRGFESRTRHKTVGKQSAGQSDDISLM